MLKIPREFKSFKDFLNFFTNNCKILFYLDKQDYIQRFYDTFVGDLRQAIYFLKGFLKDYIEFLDQTKHDYTL